MGKSRADCPNGCRPRRAIGASSRVGVGSYAAKPGPNDEKGRPLPKVTSNARTTRRRFDGSILAAATGSTAAKRRCNPIVSPSASSAARIDSYCGGISSRSTIERRYKPVPPTSNATRPQALRNHSPLTGSKEVCDRGACVALIQRQRVVDGWFRDVDHVMAHSLLFERRRLGRADVHAPIHLHRIDGHDLDISDRLRHCHRDRRFA